MKVFSILISLIFMFNLSASEREIVVLDSITTPEHLPFWRSKNYDISKDIEKKFRHYFAKTRINYKIVYIHQADREILVHYLTSTSTLALFWVSHAAAESSFGSLPLSSAIMDIYGNDLKNIFQIVGPNIKFVSIIGCEANKILEEFKMRGLYNPNLVLHSFDKKIALKKGIKKAIEASLPFLKPELNYTDHSEELPVDGLKINIINTNSFSAELTIGKTYIGLLKKEKGPQSFLIPRELLSDKFKIVVNFDVRALKTNEAMLPLKIEAEDDSYEINFLKDKQGLPYGLNKNFYVLKRQ